MSLSQTQEIMMVCREIIELLNNAELKTTHLVKELPATKETLATFRELERVAIRYLAIVQRMGLNDNVQNQIRVLSQLIVILRMAHMSYTMLTRGTFIGTLMGLASLTMTAFSIYDVMEGT
jgi:hypothetical protein